MKRSLLLTLILSIILLIIPIVRAQCDYYINSLPYTINQSGVYCLNNTFYWSGTSAITISASNVVLDFQGHSITSNGDIYKVVYVSSNQHNITIKNGDITTIGGSITDAIYIDSGCSNITINNITIYADSGTTITTPIYIGSGNVKLYNVKIEGPGTFSNYIIESGFSISGYVVIENSIISISNANYLYGISIDGGALNISNTQIVCYAGTEKCRVGIDDTNNIYANNLTVEGFYTGIKSWSNLVLNDTTISKSVIGIETSGSSSFNITNSRICNNSLDIEFGSYSKGEISNSYFNILYPNSRPILNYPDTNYWCNGTPHSIGDYITIKVCPNNITSADVPCNITSPGVYYLSEDLNITDTHGSRAVISIQTSNVTLDCQGHTIYIDNSSDFVYGIDVANVSNITIKNCKIVGGGYRNILVSDSKDVYIINSTIENSRDYVFGISIGIEISSTNINSSVFVIDSNITGNEYGIYGNGIDYPSYYASNITVQNSRICGNSYYDVYAFEDTVYNKLLAFYEITDSYFDSVAPDTSAIVNYPDNNYYCNGTPRFNIPSGCDYVITSLPYIINQSGVYCITQNLTYNGTTNVITINTSNVVINCLGNSINTVNSGFSGSVFYSNGNNNITIENCKISTLNYINAINIHSGSNISIINVTTNGSTPQIYIYNSNHVFIKNTTLSIRLDGSNNTIVENVNSNEVDIFIESSYSVIVNNFRCFWIDISKSYNITLINGYIYGTYTTASIADSNEINLIDVNINRVGNNTPWCVAISNSSVKIINSTIHDCFGTCIEIDGSESYVILNNSKIYNGITGIHITGGNVTIIGANITNSTFGIEVNNSNITYIYNSRICNNGVDIYAENTSYNLFVYDSYFDTVDPNTSVIANYPDNNYYCNGTPRFTINVNYTLSIVIKTNDNIPLRGITVEINGINYTTNESGEVSVQLPSNTNVTVTVYDNQIFEFSRWSNGSTDRTLQFTLDSNTTLTAIYVHKSTVYINTSTCNWLQYLINKGNVTIYLYPGVYDNSICGNVTINNTKNVKIIGLDKNNVIIHNLTTWIYGGIVYHIGWLVLYSENITLSNMTIEYTENGVTILNSSVVIDNLVIRNVSANGITQPAGNTTISIINTYVENCNIGLNLKNATVYNVTAIKSNINLEVWGYAYINKSVFCYHNVVTGYEDDIKIFGGTVYLYNSYFDDIEGTEYVVDYPDHNYYCNGTPRFTVNYTLLVKTVLENNTPIRGITVEINGINYTTNESGEVSVLIQQGTEVTVTVYDTKLYKFIKWSNGSTSRTLTFVMDSNKTLTAIYTLISLKIHIIEPKNNSIFNTTTVPVVINATVNLTYCNITVNNETYTINANNTTEVNTTLTLVWGNYTLIAVCEDIFGRTASDGPILFTVKQPIKFAIIVLSPKNNSNITGKYVLVKIIGNKNISRCIVTIDNTKYEIIPASPTTVISKVFELDYGIHTLYADCWSTENEYSSYGAIIFKLVPRVVVPSIIRETAVLVQSPSSRQVILLLILLGILLIILALLLKKKKVI